MNLSVDNRRSKINMGMYGVSSYVLLNWKYLSVCQLSKPLRTRKMGGGVGSVIDVFCLKRFLEN